MTTIIAGSRGITDYAMVEQAMAECGWHPSKVIAGDARGVDKLAERWARERGLPFEEFKADWQTSGKAAGYLRNMAMAHSAEALVAIWDGSSRGTMHMINIAGKKRLRVFIFRPERVG